MGYALRQAALAALAVNAVRPLRTRRSGTPVFAAGWLTSELAPQLLAAQAVDTAISLLRRRASPAGLALAAVAAGGLAWNLAQANASGAYVDAVLRDGLGGELPENERSRVPLSLLAQPFRIRHPEVEVVRDVAYTEGGRKARLDVYRPRGGVVVGAPVLVQVHGGAWTTGSKEQQGQLLMNRMAARGWVCVAVNYRLAPTYRWPTQIVDVKRAMAWVHEHIGEYGGDPGHVVVTGGSAGGHLAALVALTPGEKSWQPGFEDADTSVVGCVPFYGVYDMVGDDGDPFTVAMRDGLLAHRIFEPGATHDDFRKASPVHRVTPDAPDFFVIHGTNDTLVEVGQARRFVDRLRRVSDDSSLAPAAPRTPSVVYAELPMTQHAFEVFGSVRAFQVIKNVERWLEWHHTHHHPKRS
jgi:acetyl esterase/lipase